MKKQIITFGTVLLFAVTGFAAAAQDNNNPDPVAARLAARRAAEAAAAGDAAPATPADTGAPTAADAVPASAADTGATNAAGNDPDEIIRKAKIAAAIKELANSPASLEIITRRNIFDPRRQPYVAGRPPQEFVPPTAPVRVVAFYLTGTSHKIGKGWLCFFDGDGVPSYPPTRVIGDMINEFKIVDITNDEVKLINTKSTNSEEIILEPFKGLTRSDDGPWTPAYNTPTYGTPVARIAPPDAGMGLALQNQPAMQPMTIDDGSGATMTFGGNQDDTSGFGGGGRRQRGGRGGGGGGGGGGRNRGGYGGGGGGNANPQFAPPVTIDPNAPVDPIVLARLAARRAAEQ